MPAIPSQFMFRLKWSCKAYATVVAEAPALKSMQGGEIGYIFTLVTCMEKEERM